MAGPGVFHVEFGINETILTRALERGQFELAEKIIREAANPSFLDEGCYQRTPLYIALCGMDEEEENLTLRNFYIAKLMLEHGANVNYRVPATLYGSEYLGPGKTPLELVVDFYNLITKQECHTIPSSILRLLSQWDPHRYPVIGLHNRLVLTYEEILDQIEDLLFIIISNGGDVNVKDEFHMTPLHQTLVLSKDLRCAQILCESGADLNAKDFRGNTPLISLCDAFPWGIQKFLDDKPLADPYTDHQQQNKENFLFYVLSLPGVNLDVQNKRGRTALFNCMVTGNIETAQVLLRHGANPALKGQLTENRSKIREVSPLMAALCSLKVLCKHEERHLSAHVPKSYQFLAHLVDAGYFDKPEISRELMDHINSDFPEFSHLKSFGKHLVSMMFGGTSATLRQKCARTLFQNTFITKNKPDPSLFPADQIGPYFTLEAHDHPDDYMFYLSHVLNSQVLERLVDKLALPRDSLAHLEVELLRQRMYSKFRQFKWFKYYDEEIDGVYSYNSNSDDESSEGDESDLEYW